MTLGETWHQDMRTKSLVKREIGLEEKTRKINKIGERSNIEETKISWNRKTRKLKVKLASLAFICDSVSNYILQYMYVSNYMLAGSLWNQSISNRAGVCLF